MRVLITGDNLEITDRIRELVTSKLAKPLGKYLPSFNQEIKTADLNIQQHSRWGYILKFNLTLPKNHQIYAKARQEKLPEAVVKLRHQLEKQIKTYRGKLNES